MATILWFIVDSVTLDEFIVDSPTQPTTSPLSNPVDPTKTQLLNSVERQLADDQLGYVVVDATGSVVVFTKTGTTFTKVTQGRAWCQFGQTTSVPAGGTRQLEGPGLTLAGYAVPRAGTITGGSVSVDTADGSRSYQLQIRVNGVTAATIALPSGSTVVTSTSFSVPVAAGDLITAFMVRTAGAGTSTFTEQHAVVEIRF